jgi:ABC-type Fe3+-hydroxamate transport system substrate-binding protein
MEEAEEYSGYINGYMETVKSRTEGLSEDEKPKVFLGQLHQGLYYASGAGSTRDAMCSMAGGIKLFHPDLFDDLDPQAIHEVYLDRFQGIPITYEEEGVFFYP